MDERILDRLSQFLKPDWGRNVGLDHTGFNWKGIMCDCHNRQINAPADTKRPLAHGAEALLLARAAAKSHRDLLTAWADAVG